MKLQSSSAARSSTGMVNQAGHTTAASGDPLPSWNEGAAKASIVSFVRATTDAASPDYVRPEERIATFDNDGTLWTEQPYYFQFAFALDQIKALAPQTPGMAGPGALQIGAGGRPQERYLPAASMRWLQIVAATHFGMTTDEFEAEVRKWLASTRHPHTNRPYHRYGVPADAGGAGLSARQRLQDVHRLGRRHRIHADLCRT